MLPHFASLADVGEICRQIVKAARVSSRKCQTERVSKHRKVSKHLKLSRNLLNWTAPNAVCHHSVLASRFEKFFFAAVHRVLPPRNLRGLWAFHPLWHRTKLVTEVEDNRDIQIIMIEKKLFRALSVLNFRSNQTLSHDCRVHTLSAISELGGKRSSLSSRKPVRIAVREAQPGWTDCRA